MKYCSKCGKEIVDEAVVCPSCGCAVKTEKVPQKEVSYDAAVKGALTTNIISAVIIILGIISWLFINMWLGAILCLVAEFIALIPNTKIQSAFKKNGLNNGDKKEMKAKRREIMKELRSKYPAYKFSMVVAIVALVFLIVFIMFI